MVGVISSPKEVIEMYDKEGQWNFENAPVNNSTTKSQQQSSAKSPLQERNSDTSASTSESSKPRSIRPLVGTSQLTSPVLGGDKSIGSNRLNMSALSPSGNENIPLPTASTGLLTKAMEYMFGW